MTKEELLAKWSNPQKVGTDGHVRLVDTMGDDSSVVQAARVSYGKGTKSTQEDTDLIRYLMRHRHTTPLEMCEIKLHMRVPMDIWRQLIRHRTASVNEYSTRYSEALDSETDVTPEEWRLQSTNNKQGSSGFLVDAEDLSINGHAIDPQSRAEYLTSRRRAAISTAKSAYQAALDIGIAREQARSVLPLATYTEAYWKIDLHNLFHFLKLRLDSHAQLEIREFAQAISNIVKDWVPACWGAFEDYQLNAVTFSAKEMVVIRKLLGGHLGNYTDQWDSDSDIPEPDAECVAVDVGGMYGSHVYCRPFTVYDLVDEGRRAFFTECGLTNQRERIELWHKIKNSTIG